MDALDALLTKQASGNSGGMSSDPLADLLAKQAAAPKHIDAPDSAPAAVKAGATVNNMIADIPRQLGLTARYALEGPAQAAQVITEPLRYLTDLVTPDRKPSLSSLVTGQTPPKSTPLGVQATKLADWLGLPKPADANERVIGDATRLLSGAGGIGAAGRAAAGVPGLVGQAGEMLSANMPQQLASATGAGLAGGAVREAGGGPLTQAAASLAGGVGGGLVPGGISSGVNAARSLVSRQDPSALDQQISVLLQRGGGVDFSQLPNSAKSSLRQDVASALRAGGDLDPQAVRRLAEFRAVGATPTRGMVTLDPVQITREQNLAKIAANTADADLHGLPQIQNANNATLIRNLNDAGATQGDPFSAGQAALGSILGRDASMEQAVNSLYQQARDTAGRPVPLNGAAFTTQANQALDEAMLGYALPPSVQTRMNQIAQGEHPFTIDYAEQFKKQLNALHGANANNPAAQRAIGVVRRALDDTPMAATPQVNPGNLPAIVGTVPPSPQVLGRQSMDAFDAARAAARQRFAWQERGRPVEAALNGAQPDRFVQQFVLNGTVDDARAVAQNAPVGDVKNAILAHLKDKALNGAADEVGKFSQSAYNKALDAIGDRKLSLFFSPQEMQQLRSVGRVASYMQAQPVGSAVNNSNSGALLLGKGYDLLKGLAAKIPAGQSLIVNPLNNIEIAMKNRAAQNVVPGLLTQVPQAPVGQNLLLPGLAMGGLLAAPAQ